MNETREAIALQFYYLQLHGQKHYTHPGVIWALDNLKTRYETCIRKSCYYYHLKGLVDGGYIKRYRRWTKPMDGLVRSLSGNVYLLAACFKYLKVRGIEKSGECLNKFLKWAKRNKIQLVGPSDIRDPAEIMKAKGVLAKLPEFIKPFV